MIKRLFILIIEYYRNSLSSLKLPTCKFYPTCSQYTKDAVVKYGIIVGALKGFWRILRCNPINKGGYDPA